MYFAGIFEGGKLPTIGQRDRIIERPLPRCCHQANMSAPACVNFTKTPEPCLISQPLAIALSIPAGIRRHCRRPIGTAG